MKNGTLTYRVGELEKSLDKVDVKLNKVLTNDLPHIQETLTQVVTDVAWLKRSYWLVAGASVGALATGVISLLSK